jgi:hypothetical protein
MTLDQAISSNGHAPAPQPPNPDRPKLVDRNHGDGKAVRSYTGWIAPAIVLLGLIIVLRGLGRGVN